MDKVKQVLRMEEFSCGEKNKLVEHVCDTCVYDGSVVCSVQRNKRFENTATLLFSKDL